MAGEEKGAAVGNCFGRRVLGFRSDDQTLRSWRDEVMPVAARGEDALDDLQLTPWPANANRRALPQEWRIDERGLRRTVTENDIPVAAID